MPMKAYKAPIVVLLIIATGVAVFFWLSREKPIEVSVKSVLYGPVQDTVSNTRAGTVKACRRAGISPPTGGQIVSLPVKEGDEVDAGELLMELWNEDLLAQLEQATGEAKMVESSAMQVCIKSNVAKREANRQKRLRQDNLTSEEAVDRADGEARAQQSACNAALAQKEVSAAKIKVVNAGLDRTRLTAPFAGIVAEVNGEIGEFVTPSPVGIPTPPSIDLIDVSCLYVSAPIDEVDAPQIRVGMPANISLDAMAKEIFKGTVRRVAPYVLELEKQARTVDVEVDFNCQEDCRGMLPGYSADIEVVLNRREEALRIPTEAMLEGNKVLLLGSDDVLEEIKIDIGLSNWDWTEVTDGLAENQEVVVSVEREGVENGVSVARDTQSSDD